MIVAAALIRKKEVLTICQPLPDSIPRQLAIDILHSHGEVIMLNPAVIGYKPIKAPNNASSDELSSTWYRITERFQYVPGIGKMGSSNTSFNGCFHSMPWGLQTHIYAPMNVNLRIRYSIAGNQPNVELPQPLELGLAELGAPANGLYLREDIEFKCSLGLIPSVKSRIKAASQEMVNRIITKAKLLDAGVLQHMIEHGRTGLSPQLSPATPYQTILNKELLSPSTVYEASLNSQLDAPCDPIEPHQFIAELPAEPVQLHVVTAQTMELPGDYIYPGRSSESPKSPHQ